MKFLKILFFGILGLLVLGFAYLVFSDGPAIELNTAGQFEYAPAQNIQLNQFEKKK